MRAWSIPLAVSCCAMLLAGCGGTAMGNFQPRPGEHFSVTKKDNPGATLSDLASQVTTDTLLQHRGAKMVKAQPFPACPGEAGLQAFILPSKAVLQVAFTQWNGVEKIASYERPGKTADDPAAMDQMRHTVCTS